LSPDAGELVCARCYESEAAQAAPSGIIGISARALVVLRGLRASALRAAATLPESMLIALARATHAFVEFHMGRSSRALKAASGRQ